MIATRACFAVILLTLAVCAGCASQRLQRTRGAASAASLLLDGCFDCLVEARDIYADLAARGVANARLRQFEAELLLALRRKELALDAVESLSTARALVSGLPSSAGLSQLVDVVSRLPGDAYGTPQEELAAYRFPNSAAREAALRDAVAVVESATVTPTFRAYVRTAVECSYGDARATQPAGAPAPEAAVPPLLAYRRATCGDRIDVAALGAVRTAVPRFAEASVFIGRAAFADLERGSGEQARAALEAGYARFPGSPMVTYHLATLARLRGDCRAGLDYFDRTLALRERHEGARLGRAICRTSSGDSSGAISDATNLIDRGTANLGEALYWRAWNLRATHRLDEARADADRGKRAAYNTRIFTLAGMIEHDQGDYIVAAADLIEAKEIEEMNCGARWYLGLVRAKQGDWPASAGEFVGAADCYDTLAAMAEAERRALSERSDLPESFRVQQDARLTEDIVEHGSGASTSALHAARGFARAGDRNGASRLAQRAWMDPARREEVEKLQQEFRLPAISH